MSDYYQQEFISPIPLIAKIKEELKSYFMTGVCDDLLFPIYISSCLTKLSRGTLSITPMFLYVSNYVTDLPEEFKYIRELWATTVIEDSYTDPSSVYQQLTFKIDGCTPPPIYCDECSGCTTPEVIKAVYRTTNTVLLQCRKTFLLEPGNMQTRDMCRDSPNLRSVTGNKFDIRGKKLTVEFEEGLLYMKYYSEQFTEEGYQLIPEDFTIQEYIEAFLKAKLFENISNSVTDETYNQVQQKMMYYKQVADEKLVIARTNMKKRTPQQNRDAAIRSRNRMNKYNL